ncbi:MAG: hypothetical protein QOD86_493, partial [Miltoncostaeaceae bacterium]|nr:hypothetical protein [Miltoncostaeaceae bacterium]
GALGRWQAGIHTAFGRSGAAAA